MTTVLPYTHIQECHRERSESAKSLDFCRFKACLTPRTKRKEQVEEALAFSSGTKEGQRVEPPCKETLFPRADRCLPEQPFRMHYMPSPFERSRVSKNM